MLPYEVKRASLETLGTPRTKVMMNLANPEEAFSLSFIPNEGAGMLAAAFYPKDVILRLSDFKTNEYANLIGGKPYQPNSHSILVAMDFSPYGAAALKQAVWLARQTGAHLLYIIDSKDVPEDS